MQTPASLLLFKGFCPGKYPLTLPRLTFKLSDTAVQSTAQVKVACHAGNTTQIRRQLACQGQAPLCTPSNFCQEGGAQARRPVFLRLRIVIIGVQHHDTGTIATINLCHKACHAIYPELTYEQSDASDVAGVIRLTMPHRRFGFLAQKDGAFAFSAGLLI